MVVVAAVAAVVAAAAAAAAAVVAGAGFVVYDLYTALKEANNGSMKNKWYSYTNNG